MKDMDGGGLIAFAEAIRKCESTAFNLNNFFK
jgi:hypothetical protein